MSRISIATVCDLREQESSRVKTSVHVNETTHIEQLPNWTIGESFFWIALANAVTISTRQQRLSVRTCARMLHIRRRLYPTMHLKCCAWSNWTTKTLFRVTTVQHPLCDEAKERQSQSPIFKKSILHLHSSIYNFIYFRQHFTNSATLSRFSHRKQVTQNSSADTSTMSVALLACLLLAVAVNDTTGRGQKPTNVVIGGLFPYNVDGEAMAVGAQIALANARNQSSGLEPLSWFKANPDVNITLFNTSSEGTQRGAFEGALSIKDRGAKIIIGPAYSTESVVVSLLANVFEFAIVSYASTSPRLSDKTAYPYFFRNVPSDNAQGIALAELVKFLKHPPPLLSL
jgi:hypothetical protein